MAEPTGSADQAVLWRLWRDAAALDRPAGTEPDALTLAAYAEGRLAPAAVDAVEDWLAMNPWAIGDVGAAQRALTEVGPTASEAVIARAAALVEARGEILAFRRPAPQPSWRRAAMWGAMAASIVLASLAGFATGSDTYMTLTGDSQLSLSQQLLDPPIGLFDSVDGDSSI
jgi:hypothetical protein